MPQVKSLCSRNWLLLGLTILWAMCLLFLHEIPLGDTWWDYLGLESLGEKLFESGTHWRDVWHPFVAAPSFFHLGVSIGGLGTGYLWAHWLVWVAYFAFLAIPAQRRLNRTNQLAFLLYSMIFLLIPVQNPQNLDHVTGPVFAVFYNRYLDVMFGGVFLLLTSPHVEDRRSDVALAAFLLLLSFFSKLSYFVGYLACFSIMIGFQKRYRFIPAVILAVAMGLTYHAVTGYLSTNMSLLVERLQRGAKLHINQRAIWTGVLLPALLVLLLRRTSATRLSTLATQLTLPALLISFVQRGNHGDLGPVPYAELAFLSLAGMLHRLSINGEIALFRRQGNVSSAVFGQQLLLPAILFLPSTVVLTAAVKIVTYTMGSSAAADDQKLRFDYIPGFYLPTSVSGDLTREKLFFDARNFLSGEGAHTPLGAYTWGLQLDRTIARLRTEDIQGPVYFSSYPSGSLELLAKAARNPAARSWLNELEVSGSVEEAMRPAMENSKAIIFDRCLNTEPYFWEQFAAVAEPVAPGSCFWLAKR